MMTELEQQVLLDENEFLHAENDKLRAAAQLDDKLRTTCLELRDEARAESAKLRAAATNLMAAINDMRSRGETFTGRVLIAAADMEEALRA